MTKNRFTGLTEEELEALGETFNTPEATKAIAEGREPWLTLVHAWNCERARRMHRRFLEERRRRRSATA